VDTGIIGPGAGVLIAIAPVVIGCY